MAAGVGIAGLAVAVVVAVSGCGGTPPGARESSVATASSPPVTGAGIGRPLRGFSLSPRSAEDLAGFFDLAAAHGDLIERVGDILEWEDPGSALGVVDSLAGSHGYIPVSVAGVAETETGAWIRPVDDAMFDRYVAVARAYADRRRPLFLGLGVEVDTQWRASPDDFDRFVDLFAAVADAVHEVSPSTRVFTVFQLERLSGLQGGLFGGENDRALAAWELIDRFPDADIIAFTTYPGLVFTSPEEIPEDYYARLGRYTGGRPLAITEMGWHAGGDFGDYSGSTEEQARFLERFGELIEGVDLEFYVWSFLYDQEAPEPFDTIGLFDSQGRARPAWTVWMESGR